MALLKWYEDMNAADCLEGHETWNQLMQYVRHSSCTDFKIFSTCTSTGQAFRFTQAGTTSKSYGGASTGDDREIFANDTDDYPVIKLLGDSDAEIQVELGDFFWFYENALKTIRFSRDSNDCQIKGGDNTIRDLSLWANTIDPYPYIKLTGSGDIDFHYNTARDIFFYEQANERFKFYEHSIDFNNDRAIYINDDETYIGHGAGDAITTGLNNTFIGHDAGHSNTGGNYNTATGDYALRLNTTGANNTAIGYNSLVVNTTGHHNTANGVYSLYKNTTGSENTAVGYNAGYSSATVNGGVYLGYHAGYSNTTANRLYINNSASHYPLIWGDFANDKVKFGDNNAAWNFQFFREDDNSVICAGEDVDDDLYLRANSSCTLETQNIELRIYGSSVCTQNIGGFEFRAGEGSFVVGTDTMARGAYFAAKGQKYGNMGFYENAFYIGAWGNTNYDVWLNPSGTGKVKWGTETTNAGSDRGKLIAMKTAAGNTVYLKTYDTV